MANLTAFGFEVFAGLFLILAAVLGRSSRSRKALGVGFAGGFLVVSYLEAYSNFQYGGAAIFDIVHGVALALAMLSWGISRPFRGPGYFALIALVVFGVIGFLLTNPSISWVPNSEPVYVSLAYVVMLLATVVLAVLLERQSVTKAIATAATATTARVSAAVSGISGSAARTIGAPVARAWASTAPTPGLPVESVPIAEVPVAEIQNGGVPYPGAPSFGVSSWNTGAARPSGPANGKARASLGLAIGALAINLVGRGVPGASEAIAFVALAILVVAVVLGHLARREIRRTNERGAGQALAGLIIGYIVFVVNVVVTVFLLVVLSSHHG